MNKLYNTKNYLIQSTIAEKFLLHCPECNKQLYKVIESYRQYHCSDQKCIYHNRNLYID